MTLISLLVVRSLQACLCFSRCSAYADLSLFQQSNACTFRSSYSCSYA